MIVRERRKSGTTRVRFLAGANVVQRTPAPPLRRPFFSPRGSQTQCTTTAGLPDSTTSPGWYPFWLGGRLLTHGFDQRGWRFRARRPLLNQSHLLGVAILFVRV